MISSSYISKPSYKNSPDSRARTPNKKSVNRLNQRESKSLAKKEQKIENFNALSLMEPIKQFNEANRYYYLSRGNNHQAVRRALSQRRNLAETTNTEGILFKWTQNNSGFKYHKLGKDILCYNHFEFHREITNKQRLVWNMLNFCESNKLNAFSYIPTTFIIDLTTGQEDMALHNFLKYYNRNIPQGYTGQKVASILLPKIKHLPYISPQQLRKRSQGNFYCKPTCPKTFFNNANGYLWILKPTCMNRGRGVTLFNNLAQFQKLIWQYYQGEGLEDYQDKQGIGQLYRISGQNLQIEESSNQNQMIESQGIQTEPVSPLSPVKDKQVESSSPQKVSQLEKKTEIKVETKQEVKIEPKSQEKVNNNLRVLSFIVQKYIECPMLIRERKFDIRVWALLTQNYEVYFFKEGYLRFSSHKYTADNHKNPFIHLTNNSVQKHCNEYDGESGNQLTLSDIRDYLPSSDVYNKIQTKIRQMIWLSMCSARRKININGRRQCFQLFGFDFMVDQSFRTWLIEINTNPAIQESTSILKMLIPRLLDDMFKLTLDRIFNLKYIQNHQDYPVKGYNEQNMWQLLGDFREGINEKTMGKKLTLVRR